MKPEKVKPQLTSDMLLKKSKRLRNTGWIAGSVMFAAGTALTIVGIIGEEKGGSFDGHYWSFSGESEISWKYLAPGIALMAGGIATTTTCLVRSHKLKKQASQFSVSSVPLYQYEFHLKNGTSLSPSLDILKDNTQCNTTLGIGLTYNF